MAHTLIPITSRIAVCECGQPFTASIAEGLRKKHELHVRAVNPTLCEGEIIPFQVNCQRYLVGEPLNKKPHQKI